MRPHTDLNVSRTSGISPLDDRPQGFCSSCYKAQNPYIASVRRCCYFVLRGALLLHSNDIRLLVYCVLSHGRYGNYPVNNLPIIENTDLNQLAHPDYLYCLLHGVYSHRNQ
jgi:hypothetical protein